jgi:hypothetical protein
VNVVHLVGLAGLVLMVKEDRLVLLDLQDLAVNKADEELRASVDQQDLLDLGVYRVNVVQVVQRVPLVLQAQLDDQVNVVLLDQVDHQDQMVPLVSSGVTIFKFVLHAV